MNYYCDIKSNYSADIRILKCRQYITKLYLSGVSLVLFFNILQYILLFHICLRLFVLIMISHDYYS